MFDYLTKTSIISLKEFTADSINCLGWELHLSIRSQRFLFLFLFVCLFTQYHWTQSSDRDLVEHPYSMILANNTKWVSNELFGCGKVKLTPLGRGYLHHLITELLLVWPVGHMDPHATDWITKPSQVPCTGNQPTWMWRLNLQSHS